MFVIHKKKHSNFESIDSISSMVEKLLEKKLAAAFQSKEGIYKTKEGTAYVISKEQKTIIQNKALIEMKNEVGLSSNQATSVASFLRKHLGPKSIEPYFEKFLIDCNQQFKDFFTLTTIKTEHDTFPLVHCNDVKKFIDCPRRFVINSKNQLSRSTKYITSLISL